MTEISRDERPTLVLGGRGKTGRRVVQRLTARGLPVRVGSRSGQPPFDWEDTSTWAPALQGVRAAQTAATSVWAPTDQPNPGSPR